MPTTSNNGCLAVKSIKYYAKADESKESVKLSFQ